MHPLSQQCEAKSKRSGQRCKRRVIAGTVCDFHGGRAAQIKQKRLQAVAVWEATQNQKAVAREPREPEAVLLSALDDADTVLARIKAELSESGLSSSLLTGFGDWLDRTGRLAKIVLDGNIRDRLNDRLAAISQAQANALMDVLNTAFADPRVIILDGTPDDIILAAMDAVQARNQAAIAA